MADRPILFSTPMIWALLAGRKTQTRRVHHTQDPEFRRTCDNGCDGRLANMCILPAATCGRRWVTPTRYGIGDRLWVREAHYLTDDGDEELPVFAADDADVRAHLAKIEALPPSFPEKLRSRHRRLRPAMHLPRWASRLTLVVTDVRVERLQEISRDDAIAEGIVQTWGDFMGAAPAWAEKSIGPDYGAPGSHLYDNRTSAQNFRFLWDSLNAKRGFGWAANPWVCAVTFTVHRCNIDSMEAGRG